MRKVLSWVLVLALVLGSFSMAFAATSYSDVKGTACEEAVTVLSDLDVVNGYEDGTYQPEKVVTRAEAAKLIISALGVGDMAAGGTTTFSDMSGYEWAAGYIGYAQSLGLLKGYEDGTFRPGNTVSYQEWATILIRAIGYTDDSLQGTWPANYVSKAQGLGIFDDVTKSAGGANRGDVAIMLYNTIDLKIGTVNKDDEWVANTGKTATIDGVKVDLGDRMIFKLGADGFNQQVVTGDEESAINLAPYVGAYATVYTKGDKVLVVADIKSEFIKGDFKLDSGDVTSTFKGDDDVEYSIKDLTATTAKFLNGKFTGDSKVEDLVAPYQAGVTLSAKVSGKNITEVYAVMKWKETAAQQVDKADIADINDEKELLGESFPTLRSGEVDTMKVSVLGVSSLDKIAEDNIVAVYTEKGESGKDITRVQVGTEVVKGEVTKVKTASDTADYKYTINGTDYKASKLVGSDYSNLSDANKKNGILEVGDEVEAFLDYGGKIYTTDASSTSATNYAVVLLNAGTSGYDTNYQIKLLTADGSETIYTFKNKSTYEDTYAYDATANAPAAIAGELVTYKLNKDGKLTDLLKIEKGGVLSSGAKLSAKGVVDGMLITDDIVVFTRDSKGDYDTVSRSSVNKDNVVSDGTAKYPYALNNKGKVAAMIIDSKAGSDKDNFGLVSSYAATKNSDGDNVYEVEGVIKDKAISYLTDDKSDSKKSRLDNTDKLYKFELDGEEITEIEDVALIEDTVVLDSFGTKDGVVYVNGAGTGKTLAGFTAYEVTGVDSGRIEINGKYEIISDANVYVPTFDKDDDFDAWKVGSTSNVAKGGYIVLVQTDDDSDNWDTVVFVKKADIEKYWA